MRRRLLVALIVLAPIAARAQPVEVATLAPPDAFTTPGRATGLGADLWREASPDTLKAVMPRLTEKGLSKAAAALARRVLATGAPAPKGLGSDPDLLAPGPRPSRRWAISRPPRRWPRARPAWTAAPGSLGWRRKTPCWPATMRAPAPSPTP